MLRALGSLGAIGLIWSCIGIAEVSAQNLPLSCTGFTDDPLVPGVTTVKAQHVTELRACVDDLRVEVSLARVSWTDLVVQPEQTWIRAVHLTELRTALHDVYVARGQSEVAYTDPALTPNSTVVRAAHITEIRQAALRVSGVCAPEDCGGPVNTALEYFHLDALGSVRAVTDEAGVVLRRHDYFPFGEGDAPPAGDNPLGFAGKEGDPETGLSYFEARYYRAWVGRFTTVDPVVGDTSNPQRWNRYAYALNNPLTYSDPTGLLAQGPSSGCSAEFSFGSCGGNDLFWSTDGGGIGFEFGNGFALAQQRGYVLGMPANVWNALDNFNAELDAPPIETVEPAPTAFLFASSLVGDGSTGTASGTTTTIVSRQRDHKWPNNSCWRGHRRSNWGRFWFTPWRSARQPLWSGCRRLGGTLDEDRLRRADLRIRTCAGRRDRHGGEHCYSACWSQPKLDRKRAELLYHLSAVSSSWLNCRKVSRQRSTRRGTIARNAHSHLVRGELQLPRNHGRRPLMRIIGVGAAVLLALVISINGVLMLASPRAWFNLRSRLKLQGSLTEEQYATGWGAVQVRLTGASFLAMIVWVLYVVFLSE
jgi:RHS repeat-associated protein